MLVISRRRDESVIIKDDRGTEIGVRVLEFKEDGFGRRVVLGISAPREWPVLREELLATSDTLAALRAAFEDAPPAVQRQFVAEMGTHLLANTTCEMLNSFMHKLQELGLVQLERRPDGTTVFASTSGKQESEKH